MNLIARLSLIMNRSIHSDKPHIKFFIDGVIVEPTSNSNNDDESINEPIDEQVTDEQSIDESINEEPINDVEPINEPIDEQLTDEQTIEDPIIDEPIVTPIKVSELRFYSHVLQFFKGVFSEIQYPEYDLLPAYTDYFAYRVKIMETNCMITTHPSNNKTYLAIPNLFYYDNKHNTWNNALIENQELSRQLQQLILTPGTYLQRTNLFFGTKSDCKPLFKLAVFPDSVCSTSANSISDGIIYRLSSSDFSTS